MRDNYFVTYEKLVGIFFLPLVFLTQQVYLQQPVEVPRELLFGALGFFLFRRNHLTWGVGGLQPS